MVVNTSSGGNGTRETGPVTDAQKAAALEKYKRGLFVRAGMLPFPFRYQGTNGTSMEGQRKRACDILETIRSIVDTHAAARRNGIELPRNNPNNKGVGWELIERPEGYFGVTRGVGTQQTELCPINLDCQADEWYQKGQKMDGTQLVDTEVRYMGFGGERYSRSSLLLPPYKKIPEADDETLRALRRDDEPITDRLQFLRGGVTVHVLTNHLEELLTGYSDVVEYLADMLRIPKQ